MSATVCLYGYTVTQDLNPEPPHEQCGGGKEGCLPSISVACLNCSMLQGLFGLSEREMNRILNNGFWNLTTKQIYIITEQWSIVYFIPVISYNNEWLGSYRTGPRDFRSLNVGQSKFEPIWQSEARVKIYFRLFWFCSIQSTFIF